MGGGVGTLAKAGVGTLDRGGRYLGRGGRYLRWGGVGTLARGVGTLDGGVGTFNGGYLRVPPSPGVNRQMDRHQSKHNLPVVLRTRSVIMVIKNPGKVPSTIFQRFCQVFLMFYTYCRVCAETCVMSLWGNSGSTNN